MPAIFFFKENSFMKIHFTNINVLAPQIEIPRNILKGTFKEN